MKKLLEFLLDSLFREKHVCLLCGWKSESLKNHLCAECRSGFKFAGTNRCGKCGKHLEYEAKGIAVCTECEIKPKSFSKAVAPIVYDEKAKKLIQDFKYHDKTYLKKPLSELMIEEIVNSGMEYADMLIPVPLHPKRENKRGFNQAKLLADCIGKSLNIDSSDEVVIRRKETNTQNKLGKAERARNLSSAFSISDSRKIKGKTVMVIDDIYTTGATVDEISKLLLESGAETVTVATIATSVEKLKGE